jgi:hypothetical protein
VQRAEHSWYDVTEDTETEEETMNDERITELPSYRILDRKGTEERLCRALAEELLSGRGSEPFYEAIGIFMNGFRPIPDRDDDALMRLAASLDLLEDLAADGYLEELP